MVQDSDVHDMSITRVKGMTGSVMDYNPINVAPKGQKQGDYASTTIGPYDYWAIEFAYSEVHGNEEAELKKIAARSPEPELAFATDDDFMNNDPQVNTYDLTSDTLADGKIRMPMAGELLKDLDQEVVKNGQSWARLRSAFMSCVSQFGANCARPVPQFRCARAKPESGAPEQRGQRSDQDRRDLPGALRRHLQRGRLAASRRDRPEDRQAFPAE
jgi:Met-zincin